MNERLDRVTFGGHLAELRACGVFEIEDGRIKAWPGPTSTRGSHLGRRTVLVSHPEEPRTASVISADGAEIAYDVCGEGTPALVFVHGWSGNRSHWDPQLGAFAPRHTVVRVDLAGHGESSATRTRWTVAGRSPTTSSRS